MQKIRYRQQLLEVFTLREIKSRYRSSILGFLWIFLYPLIIAVILNFVFGSFVKIRTNGEPYFVFVLIGILFWNFFQQGLNLSKDSLIWNRELVTKTSFPKSTLPLSYILSKLPDFIVNFIILLFFLLLNGHLFKSSDFLIIFLIIPLFLFSAGISLFVSLANAVFRDFGRITELLLLILFYITPIVYPHSLVPENFKFLLLLNPLSGLIVFSRELLLYNNLRFDLLLPSFTISLLIFLLGSLFFHRFEKKITDLI